MKPSVIVIGDEPDIWEVCSEFLRLKSIDVLATGNNGKDAVELYQKYRPDVVLMDFMMPDVDGLYALKNIRKLDSTARVIISIDSVDYGTYEQLTESGFSAIIQKPTDLYNLVEMINKISFDDYIQEPTHNALRFTCNRL